MARSEAQRTFSPDDDAVLPDLAALAGLQVGEPVELEVTTTYLDTAGHDLLRHGVALHRTHGGTDDGWVLELPGRTAQHGDGELVTASLSGGRTTPPAALRGLVLALTLGEPFEEVVTLRVRRSVVEVSADGEAVARVLDDRVWAPDDGRAWREWRLEAEDPSVLDEIAEPVAALAAPATDTASHAERLRALVGEPPEAEDDVPRVGRPKPHKPASRVLHRYLVDQAAAVRAADLGCRRHDPEGVHDLRVALRRLRSTLATFRPLLDRTTADALRAQMGEVSHLLGDARDAEVVGERLTRLLEDEPADLRLGAARRTIGDDRRATLRLGRRTADDTLRSDEYVALLRALRHLVAAPPWTEEAEEPAADVLPGLLARDLRRVRARMAAVEDAEGSAERARLMHEARKAAKRLRYACEAAVPVLGDDARRLRRATKELQEVLGEHHDTMATRSALRRLAGRGDLHPGTAFTLGRLHAREEQAARRLEREVDAVWARLDRRKVTGFL